MSGHEQRLRGHLAVRDPERDVVVRQRGGVRRNELGSGDTNRLGKPAAATGFPRLQHGEEIGLDRARHGGTILPLVTA